MKKRKHIGKLLGVVDGFKELSTILSELLR